jgi:hypothetical protein
MIHHNMVMMCQNLDFCDLALTDIIGRCGPSAEAFKDRRCHVAKRQPFKIPLGDLQRTTQNFGLNHDGVGDGNASDASGHLKTFPSSLSSLF